MTETAYPPRWAEALLRTLLKPGDFESVSGDLLEQYRDSIYPARGRRHADWWFAPPLDFHTRSTVSTALGVGTLLAAGFWVAWRSNSFVNGAIAGVVTAGLASVTSIAGAAAMLAIWYDPRTMAAIRGSGGLDEILSLPLMMIFPGLLLGAGGGVACTALKRLLLFAKSR